MVSIWNPVNFARTYGGPRLNRRLADLPSGFCGAAAAAQGPSPPLRRTFGHRATKPLE
ncbi:hypothetical protein CABS03_08936 [Colletotrichum abscissum]|uniref:Uncharacterized protein n=1 Tax=Colletotrichum abscissum TaxID=1671311 RepID=A0A9P9X6F0_9PEZI|nr:hypothetical protein CABS02_11720 [Colletotrichum abscissum]